MGSSGAGQISSNGSMFYCMITRTIMIIIIAQASKGLARKHRVAKHIYNQSTINRIYMGALAVTPFLVLSPTAKETLLRLREAQ